MPVFVYLPGLSGVLEVEISQLHIRRSALIKADPGIVWEEFTTFERISAWLDQGHKLLAFEPRLGGKVRFSVVIEGAERFLCTVIELLPGREITFDDGWEDQTLLITLVLQIIDLSIDSCGRFNVGRTLSPSVRGVR